MKLTIEFPSVAYRDGPTAVAELAAGIERIGFDQIDMFDHVVMAHPHPGRPVARYPATMPILEALVTLGHMAAATEHVGLGTEVLVLPQRSPVLVAKQVSTLDILSGGRVRLGVGVGWQESECSALGFDFQQRGSRMDEAISLLRACWSDDPISFSGRHFQVEAMALEPKPPQGPDLPIWIGGMSPRALKRAGALGDGWLATAVKTVNEGRSGIETVRRHAEKAQRDPARLGFQAQISLPPRLGEAEDRTFYSDPSRVAARAGQLKEAGFGWGAVNGTGVFLAGARSPAAMLEALDTLHQALRREVGSD